MSEDPRVTTLADFLQEHLPAAKATPSEKLLAWLKWYWQDARVGIVRAQGRIVAVAMARCMNDVAQAEDPFYHDENGRIVWVQDIVCLHPDGVAALVRNVVRRFGPREALAGHVLNRNGELRKLPWNHVVRFFYGGIFHGLTSHPSSTRGA